MSPDEREEFLHDGLSHERRASFATGQAAVRKWELIHPWSLDDYLGFLDSLQCAFGPVAPDTAPWIGSDFRL